MAMDAVADGTSRIRETIFHRGRGPLQLVPGVIKLVPGHRLADLCQMLFSRDAIRCVENYLLFKGLSLNCLHQVFNALVAHVIEAIPD